MKSIAFPRSGRLRADAGGSKESISCYRRRPPRRVNLCSSGGSRLSDSERDRLIASWIEIASSVFSLALKPLGKDNLRVVIEKPAAKEGHIFEPGLVDRTVLRHSGTDSGAVSQIQFALGDIWSARQRGWLTNKSYDASGGIAACFLLRLERFMGAHREQFGSATEALLKNMLQFDFSLRLAPRPAGVARAGQYSCDLQSGRHRPS